MIDKDIEYLKGYKYDNEVSQAIENVLKELDTYKRIANMKLNDKEEIIKNMCEHRCPIKSDYEEVKQELETYKKIAEFLAENIDKWGMCFGGECIGNCKQHIIDWARKEVENESI